MTLYCLSVENWKRPPRELTFLMRLLRHFLVVERGELIEQNVQLKMIGRRDGLPPDVLREFERTAEQTAANDGMVLCLAVNYGGRSEIGDAARRLAEDVRAGRIDPDQVDEAMFASYLYTEGMSDPDLLIRTAGEMRISNFLLWQISYAELWVTPTLWPDFRGDDLLQGCRAFAGRERKFGGLPSGAAAHGARAGRRRPARPGASVERLISLRRSGMLVPCSSIEQLTKPRSCPPTMLSTRVFIGLSMVAGLLLALVVDEWLAPWYPFWFLLVRLRLCRGGARADRAPGCDECPPVGKLGDRRRAGLAGRQLAAARGRAARSAGWHLGPELRPGAVRLTCWPGRSCASRPCS